MSRSNPTTLLERPCKKYIKWNGSGDPNKGGFFSYYDKETKKDIKIEPGEFRFLVLDYRLFAVTGYSKPLEAYCYSNEVRSVKDKIVIRNFENKEKGTKPGILKEGPYSELKGEGGPIDSDRRTRELKYTRCIYIFWDGEICHLQLQGTSFQNWLENIERKPVQAERDWVTFKEAKHAVSGDNEYHYAIFAFDGEPDNEESEAALEADKKVQDYLKKYLAKNGTQEEKGDDGAEEASQERNQSVDYSNWREYDMDGDKMGHLDFDAIQELHFSAKEAGIDNDYFRCLEEAVREYAQACKTWDSKTDKSGRSLKDYSLEELKTLSIRLKKEAPMNKYRAFIEAAIEAKKPEEGDDDIPF